MPPWASTNLPMWRSVAPVKAPFSWPNRIELHEIVGNGAAIDGDEWLCAPLAGAVDGARDQFLADPGAAFDQHGDGRADRLLGLAEHRLHACTAGDDVIEGQRAGAAALDALDLAFQRLGRERIAQRHRESFRAHGLDHEIDRARAHRGDHIVDAAVGGLHDHRHGEARFADARQHAQAVEIGHHEIEHDRVDAAAVGPGEECRRGIAAFGDHRLVARARDHAFEESPLHRIVVDDQNPLTHDATSNDKLVPNWGTLAELA